MKIFNKILKNLLIAPLGFLAYYRLNVVNKLHVKGLRYLKFLPKTNVLFISNHQTYYADVAALITALSAAKWGRYKYFGFPYYMISPFLNLKYVAASETMKESGWLPKVFALCGAITVDRTWRSKGQDVKRDVNTSDQDKIGEALAEGWLISFPQGTTTPFAPGRKGTAHIIKMFKPVVIPLQIDGFRRAFDKKGLAFKKKNTDLKLWFKRPLEIDYNAGVEDIMNQVIESIGKNEPHIISNVENK